MQSKEGNEQYPTDYDEEWQAGYTRRMPCMWYQDVQDWQKLVLILANR